MEKVNMKVQIITRTSELVDGLTEIVNKHELQKEVVNDLLELLVETMEVRTV